MRKYIIRHIDNIIFSIIVFFLLFVVAFPIFTTQFNEYPFTANDAFSGFGGVESFVNHETAKIEQFRWSGTSSQIVFRKQWFDYYQLGCQAKQITSLLVYAPGQQQTTMSIAGVKAKIDDRPRHMQLLQCLDDQINITSSSSFKPTSTETRDITFAIKVVTRDVYPVYVRKYTQWVIAAVVSLAFVVLSYINLWLIDGRPKFSHALLVALLMLVYWRQFNDVSIELLPLLVGCIVTTLVLKPQISVRNLRWLFWFLIFAVPLWRIGMMWWHAGTDWDLTIFPVSTVSVIPMVYQPYWLWFCIVVSAQILAWVKSPATQVDRIWWVVLIAMSIMLQRMVGYWVVNGWQNTISISDIDSWSALWNFLATLRIAIPPVLLVIEYAIRDYPVLQVVYGWCIPMIVITVCMMLQIGSATTQWYNRMIRIILTMLLLTIVMIIKGTQNFFIYDVLTGFCLIVFFQLWRQQRYTPVHLVVMGLVLVAFDMLRPFTMLFTPFLAALVMYDIYKKHGWQRIIYFSVPLLIIMVWHFNHIFVLGQLSWSNHAGFNICHAWQCPPIPLLPEHVGLNRAMWDYINTQTHQDNSQRLLAWFVQYLQANPGVILPTLTRLLQNNLVITRTSLEVIHPVVAALFTLFYVVGFVLQGVVVVYGIVSMRAQSFWVWMRDPQHIFFWYAVVLWCMFVITTVTESGENYRWMIGFVLVLGYLPDSVYEMVNVLVTRCNAWVHHRVQLVRVPHNES